jgi:predicted amidohydrolase
MGDRVKETKLPVLYVHGTGGQDELVFDGASFALDGAGLITYQAETFKESVDIVDFEGAAVKGTIARPLTEEEVIYRALMTGGPPTT